MLCRRGMKELDILMENYLINEYPHVDRARQIAFETLLEYQDPLILDLLFDRCRDENTDVQALIEQLKTYQIAQQSQAKAPLSEK